MSECVKFTGEGAYGISSKVKFSQVHLENADECVIKMQSFLKDKDSDSLSKKLKLVRGHIVKAKKILGELEITVEVC